MTRMALSLEDLQSWLLTVVTHSQSVSAALGEQARRVPPAPLGQIIRGTASATALQRLEIYRESYFLRLAECLADDFPAVRHALGAEAFQKVCDAYAETHPPSSANLNTFGRLLPEFLRASQVAVPLFVAELAQLEWAMVEIVHDHAPSGISVEELSRVPQPRLAEVRFVASPALRLLSFGHRTNDFLQAFFDGQQPTKLEPGAQHILVLRQGYRVRRLELLGEAAVVLRRLLAGEALGAALAGVTSDQASVMGWFTQWTASGAFAGFEL